MWSRSCVPYRSTICALLLLVVGAARLLAQAGGGNQPQQTQPVGPPRFEYVGPTNAGRIAAAAAVAGKPGVYYPATGSAAVGKRRHAGPTGSRPSKPRTPPASAAPPDPKTRPTSSGQGTAEPRR